MGRPSDYRPGSALSCCVGLRAQTQIKLGSKFPYPLSHLDGLIFIYILSVCVCMHVCVCLHAFACMHGCLCDLCMYARGSACMHMSVSVDMHVLRHTCGHQRAILSASPYFPLVLPANCGQARCMPGFLSLPAISLTVEALRRHTQLSLRAGIQIRWSCLQGKHFPTEPATQLFFLLLLFIRLAISLSRKRQLPISRQYAD